MRSAAARTSSIVTSCIVRVCQPRGNTTAAPNLKVCGVTEPFSMPIVPRYAEIDQQGVVFNGHYLTWFDEAADAFFDHAGVTIPALTARELDIQVVHAELNYLAPVRWRTRSRWA
jgi:hypothetical protein